MIQKKIKQRINPRIKILNPNLFLTNQKSQRIKKSRNQKQVPEVRYDIFASDVVFVLISVFSCIGMKYDYRM